MKYLLILISIGMLMSCDTAQLVDNWKNPEIDTFESTKVLIVGMTSNIEARQQFENQLKDEYEIRGVEVVMSLELFEPAFTTEKKSEKELKILEDILIANGFDTVLFTKVVGVEDKIAYIENYDNYDNTHRRFSEDYLMYQDAFYNPDYYEIYTIYHTETSLYCICPTKDRELIWKGYIDIVDPQKIEDTVQDYVRLVIVVLEEQQLINAKVEAEILDESI